MDEQVNMDSTQTPVYKNRQDANHVQDKRFENIAAGKINSFFCHYLK